MKSLKKFIFETMEQQGYVLDGELSKFCGHEPNYYMAEIYKTEYNNLQRDKEYFKYLEENGEYELKHARRMYLIRDINWSENQYKKISKVYYTYLIKKN